MGRSTFPGVNLPFTMEKNKQPREVSRPKFWENLYRKGRLGWDLGGPTPVFVNWLKHNPGDGEKVCVLGAGSGYDAIAFAEAGYRVTASEFAPTPAHNLANQAQKSKLSLEVIAGDMFKLPKKKKGHFDLILEYTTYCAIDPTRRDDYVSLVLDILKPGGRLLALFFPMDQDPTEGPPFGISYNEVDERFRPHFHFQHEEWPDHSVPTRRLRELFVIMERR